MLFGLERFPLCLYLAVLFQFGVAFRKDKPQFLINGDYGDSKQTSYPISGQTFERW